MASKGLGDENLVQAVLADWKTAPVNNKVRATLGFLEKLTLAPEAVGPEDIRPMRDAGVSEEAMIDAIHVCAMFNIVDRIADSLGFDVPSAKVFASGAPMMLKRGYK